MSTRDEFDEIIIKPNKRRGTQQGIETECAFALAPRTAQSFECNFILYIIIYIVHIFEKYHSN
jgi:hypothetical protein